MEEPMRGCEVRTGKLFSYVDLEARVPKEHPFRVIRGLVDKVLAGMSSEFEAMYDSTDRPSIPPERCCCRPSIRSARSGS